MASRALAVILVSVPVGVVELFLGIELGFIRSGDEGVWQRYVAVFSIAWGVLVAVTLLAGARRPLRAVLAVGVATLAAAVTVVSLLVTLFALLTRAGAS